MAAILGIHCASGLPECGIERRWRGATTAMASRSSLQPVEMETGKIRVHYRGERSDRVIDGNRLSVFIDGHIDNLTDLVNQRRLVRVAEASPGEQLRELFLENGPDLFADLAGDFALVLVLPESGRVFLVRDRFGTRPLFFGATSHGWCWGSELKGLTPFFEQPALDERGLAEVLHYRWLAGDRTLIKGIRRIIPGTFVTLGESTDAEVRRYWTIPWQATPPTDGPEVWVRRTETALSSYFERQFERSAKVGVFLSGGVDSSLLAAVAAQHADDCVLVTPTWERHPDPELPRARRFADHLGLEHRVVQIPDDFVGSFFPELTWRLEQPARHYNTFAWAILADAVGDCDAVVYGEAAGTMFGPRLRSIHRNIDWRQRLSPATRSLLAQVGTLLPTRTSRLKRLRQLLTEDPETMALHLGLLSLPSVLRQRVAHLERPAGPNEALVSVHLSRQLGITEYAQQILMYTMILSSMEKMDRFFTPTQVRLLTPFLSAEVVSVATRLPGEYKLRDNSSKPILRDLAEKFYPRDWIYEPKLGFPTPKIAWLEGPLRNRVNSMLRGNTPVSSLFGSRAIKSLRMPTDYEAIWTLLCIDEFVEKFLGGRIVAD